MGMFDGKPGPQAGGMEIMFRSLGLGPALDAAKIFVESGGLKKLMDFANDLPEIKSRLVKIDEQNALIIAHFGLGVPQLAALSAESSARLDDGNPTATPAGGADGGPGDLGRIAGTLVKPKSARRSGGASTANGAAHG